MRSMDCTDIKALLSALVDDTVTDDQRYEAERHLADCQACRTMLDDAEAAEALLRSQLVDEADALPAGFEQAVLAATVGPAPHRARASWMAWTGWIAAAAALGIAFTTWYSGQQRPRPDRGAIAKKNTDLETRLNAYAATATFKSEIYDGDKPPTDWNVQPTANWISPMPLPPADDLDASDVLTATDSPTAAVNNENRLVIQPTLAAVHADTLAATAVLMETLMHSRLDSFADVEEVRRITEYDELLPRLAAARMELDDADAQIVLVAESILSRIVLGPLDLADVQRTQQSIIRLDLVRHLQELSARPPATDPL
jgi:hypothetical protein